MLPGLTTSTSSDALIQQYADRVAGLVDGYAGRWYDVGDWTTSSSTPQIILQISDSLVAQAVMRSRFTKDGQNRNEWVEDLGRQAIKDLEAIRDQKLIVLDSTGGEAGRASTAPLVEGTRENYTPVFDIDADTAWTIDSDLSDDIADERD
ncbi:MAG: hypothetical protein QME32_00290 [Endomicrobiia bacterium]|nr:hypothetical protein [Endomicrobiia bacterium]